MDRNLQWHRAVYLRRMAVVFTTYDVNRFNIFQSKQVASEYVQLLHN